MQAKDKFRYAEKCLYEYKRNLSCLELLRDDLRYLRGSVDVKCQSYEPKSSVTGDPSDPVHMRVVKLEQLEERIRKLERWTKPVTSLLNDLDSPEALDVSRNKELLKVLRLTYFGKNPIEAIIEELRISRSTFYERRRDLINVTMGYMGL